MAMAEHVTIGKWTLEDKKAFYVAANANSRPKKTEEVLPKEILDELRQNPQMWKFVK